jgi:AsmA protein
MRALKIAGAAIAAVIVVAALLLIVGIPSGVMTSAIQARIEHETGYRLTISGATRIGLSPQLNVTLNDVTLQDPTDRDSRSHVTVGSIRADMTLGSVWSGHPHITELAIARPVLHVPLLRERIAASATASKAAASSGETDANALSIDRVTVSDGAIVFSNLHDRFEQRIDGINADARIDGDRRIGITGSARAGEHPLNFEIKATAPAPPMERQNIPVELTLDAPGVLRHPLSAKAEVRLNGLVVMINGVSGTLGDGAFNGWASVDIASKPLLKLDLDFQRLNIAVPTGRAASASQAPQQSWSNASIELTGLNYIDAQVRISAAELNIGETRFAPVAIDAALDNGVLKCVFPNLGAYGGQVSGELTVDVSSGNPTYAMRSDLAGVRALPLLRSAAGFDKLDGRLQAKLALHSSGASQRAIMSNLDGTVFAVFQDGAIRGLNVARMIRALTSGTLSGWQEGQEQATDLSQLSASFRVEKGQATTGDLNLVGPLVRVTGGGTVDLGEKTLAFHVEPKLVMTTEGQGRTADPIGLGVPVVIEGPWAEPRIHLDIAGIMEKPDAAYAKLKEMGKGLFGPNGALSGLGGNGSGGDGSGLSDQLSGKLGETLGHLLQQGFAQRNPATPTPSTPAAPSESDPPPQPLQDSQPMNDVLRQLFNR